MADRKPAAVQIGRKDGAALSGADIEALLRAQQRQNAAPAQWGAGDFDVLSPGASSPFQVREVGALSATDVAALAGAQAAQNRHGDALRARRIFRRFWGARAKKHRKNRVPEKAQKNV